MSDVIPFPAGRRNGHTLPLGDKLPQAIDRLKQIAAQSGDAMLTEGPVQPDHALLDLCGDALHLIRASAALADRRNACWRVGHRPTDAERDEWRSLVDESSSLQKQAQVLLRRAKKMPATTAAGVFAKALIVRSSKTGAVELAMALAEDLINCPGLRASLWPAETPAAD